MATIEAKEGIKSTSMPVQLAVCQRDEMEVVVLLVALVGIALVVIPRLQRRRAGARRPSPVKTRKAPRGAAGVPARAPRRRSWRLPPWRLGRPASADVDAWDDDLGWEGVDSAPPETREAWEQWRATDSPLAAARSSPSPPPRPSLSCPASSAGAPRRRSRSGKRTTTASAGRAKRARRARQRQRSWLAGNGNGKGMRRRPSPARGTANGRDWSRGADAPPARETDAAPAFAAAASAATDVAPAPAPQPELGRTIALEDDDWDPPVTQTGAPARARPPPRRPVAAPARRKSRTSRMHPVLLVAIYAAVGIGAVVLASTALLGGSGRSRARVEADAARREVPRSDAGAHPRPRPRLTRRPRRSAAAAAAAAEREARWPSGAIAPARCAASPRRSPTRVPPLAGRPRPAAKRKRERRQGGSPTTSGGTPSPVSTPPPTYVPPRQPAPAPKRRSVCEFCIG